MLNGLRQQAIVKPGGIVEIRSPELPAGATVQVIVLLEPPPDCPSDSTSGTTPRAF